MGNKIIRPIAIYLPQYHQVKENDVWWGEGFTEWTNVKKAKPLFKNHHQPHIPGQLGYYDLNNPEVKEAQGKLAAENNIYGFCYYHYWFNGRRILETPFNEVLNSGSPNFPFMLCWANENWTRTWDGGDHHILLEQKYSDEDDIKHIQSLIPAFEDLRYIRVNNKPVFVIYRSTKIPDIKSTILRWRKELAKVNLEVYLCRMDSFGEYGQKYLEEGFDAAINFEPFGFNKDRFTENLIKQKIKNKFSIWYIKYKLANIKTRELILHKLTTEVDYNEYVDFVINQPLPDYKIFPGITPSWDNTARRQKNFFLFKNSSPSKFRQWLNYIVENFRPKNEEENFIFINAWNEWGEGNHLEPCERWGKQYLEAVKEVTEKYV